MGLNYKPQGKGSMNGGPVDGADKTKGNQGIQMIAIVPDKAQAGFTDKEGNARTAHWIDVQVDHRDPRAKGQHGLHLGSEKQQYNGQTRDSNGVKYYDNQLEAIKEAAGDNFYYDESREQTVYGFSGEMMNRNDSKDKEGNLVRYGNIVKTSSLKPSKEGFDISIPVMKEQFKAIKEGNQRFNAERQAKSAEKAAPEVQVEQQMTEPEPEGFEPAPEM